MSTAQLDLLSAPNSDPAAVLARVVSHPGFFRVERIHAGHDWCKEGTCPRIDEHDGMPCWRYQIGVCIDEKLARVDWFEAATWEEAAAMALTAIEGSTR